MKTSITYFWTDGSPVESTEKDIHQISYQVYSSKKIHDWNKIWMFTFYAWSGKLSHQNVLEFPSQRTASCQWKTGYLSLVWHWSVVKSIEIMENIYNKTGD